MSLADRTFELGATTSAGGGGGGAGGSSGRASETDSIEEVNERGGAPATRGEDVARGAARVSATGGDRHFDELDRGRGRA